MIFPETRDYKLNVSEDEYLSREQELALFKLYKEGTEEDSLYARDKLFRSLHNYVCKIADRYARRCHHLLFEDCLQIGFLGLLKAIEKFDPTAGVRLSTYATYWIQQHINRDIDNSDNVIRVPVHVGENRRKFFKVENDLRAKLGREPTEEEIASEADFSTFEHNAVKRAENVCTVSLQTPVGEAESNSTLEDMLVDENAPEPDSEADEMQIHETIAGALSLLTPMQRYVVAQRFGLNASQETKTLEAIGDTLSLTRERVRQIEQQALRRFRKMAGVMRQLEPLRACYN